MSQPCILRIKIIISVGQKQTLSPTEPCVDSHGTAHMRTGPQYAILGYSRVQYKLNNYVFTCSSMKKPRAHNDDGQKNHCEKRTYYHVNKKK